MGKIYVGDANNIARQVKGIYVGDSNGIARKVLKGYVGDANGIAREFYSAQAPLPVRILTNVTSANIDISAYNMKNLANFIVSIKPTSAQAEIGSGVKAISTTLNKAINNNRFTASVVTSCDTSYSVPFDVWYIEDPDDRYIGLSGMYPASSIDITDYSTDMNDFACEPISHSNAAVEYYSSYYAVQDKSTSVQSGRTKLVAYAGYQRGVQFYGGNCKVYYLR